jgi:hypothetical protein
MDVSFEAKPALVAPEGQGPFPFVTLRHFRAKPFHFASFQWFLSKRSTISTNESCEALKNRQDGRKKTVAKRKRAEKQIKTRNWGAMDARWGLARP